MLVKHIISYVPSLAIPALTAFGAIYAYTRILTPEQYGHYALVMNLMTLLNMVFFYWLQVSLPRLMPQAIKDGRETNLTATSYLAFLVTCLGILAVALVVTAVVPLKQYLVILWLALPLALLRSLLNINQSIHRSKRAFKRFNIIECGQAILGLVFGLSLVFFLHLENIGAALGIILGMICVALIDFKTMFSTSTKNFDRKALDEILHFGLPLVATYGLSYVISSSDRFLIEHFRGIGEVGVYSAGYSLMDRLTSILFMLIAMPSFQLTIHRYEHEGVEAAQKQLYDNGVALLGLAIPACVGLILTNTHLAELLIGGEFRQGALDVMPWIAISAILNGLSTHYLCHVFYIIKKPKLLLYTQGPAAILNLAMNVYLIPRYGYMAAAYSTVASYLLMLCLNAVVVYRVFPFKFPIIPLVQMLLASGLMIVPLVLIKFPVTVIGLTCMITLGAIMYGLGIFLLNTMQIRTKTLDFVRRRLLKH